MSAQLPDQFFKYAIVIGVVTAGLVIVDKIDGRLGNWYVAAALLGVALSQRQGVLAFTSFLQQQASGLSAR